MNYRYFIYSALLVFVSACTMEIPAPDQIINKQLINDGTDEDGGNNSTDDALQAPIISPASMSSSNGAPVAVSISLPPSSPAGTKIYYTLDGTDPASSLTAYLYTIPFVVTGSLQLQQVKAVALNGSEFSTETASDYWFGDWETVGNYYVDTLNARMFAAENGVVYVGKQDNSFMPSKLIIQYTTAGDPWTELPAIQEFGCGGSPWFGGNFAKAFAVEEGTPYVACNQLNGVSVKKYENGSWQDVTGINNPIAPIDDPVDIILKVSNGTPYIAGVDHGNWKVRAYYFDGTDWQAMGAQPLMPFNTTRAGFDVINNIPYIAYAAPSGLYVGRFDVNTNTWIDLNTGITQLGNAYYVDLSINDNGTTNGVPYVLFSDANNDFRIIKYENGVWTYVGGVVPSSNFIKVFDGIPYISTLDANKMVIKRFDGGSWQDLGTPTFYDVGQFQTSIEIDPVTGNIHTYYNTPVGGLAESFGPNGSGNTSHVVDPLMSL